MQENILAVTRLIKKESHKFKQPIVTEVAERDEDPFLVLVSCILSLRTRDAVTDIVSRKLFSIANTPKKMSQLPLKKIENVVKSVNYYKTKARRIKEISFKLIKEYNGKVPDNFDELMKFKGVGRKTANIVMCYGFNKSGYIAVDTHVHRIPNRLGWIKTKTPEKTEEELKKILPKKYWHDFNDLFVQFGQNICLPRNPRCNVCPVSRYCKYYKEMYLPKLKR